MDFTTALPQAHFERGSNPETGRIKVPLALSGRGHYTVHDHWAVRYSRKPRSLNQASQFAGSPASLKTSQGSRSPFGIRLEYTRCEQTLTGILESLLKNQTFHLSNTSRKLLSGYPAQLPPAPATRVSSISAAMVED